MSGGIEHLSWCPNVVYERRGVSPLLTFQSALPRYLILLTEPHFKMIYGLLERHGLQVRVLRQKRKTQHPTNNVSLQDRGLGEHHGDARQDV